MNQSKRIFQCSLSNLIKIFSKLWQLIFCASTWRIHWVSVANYNLDSPSSIYNSTCKAYENISTDPMTKYQLCVVSGPMITVWHLYHLRHQWLSISLIFYALSVHHHSYILRHLSIKQILLPKISLNTGPFTHYFDVPSSHCYYRSLTGLNKINKFQIASLLKMLPQKSNVMAIFICSFGET